ncbi:MAG: YceI family protein [Solirubrobacteraceae bacterium]
MDTPSNTSASPLKLQSGDWRIDADRSHVRFHTRAMFGLFPVLGRFERFDGTLHVDQSGQASGTLTIEAQSIRTGIGLRDAHLRTKDFFKAADYPQLTFTLDRLQPDGDTHQVTGTLRIRETTLPVIAPATLTSEGSQARITARFDLDHDAAGLKWAKPGMVPKTVQADVDLTLTRT